MENEDNIAESFISAFNQGSAKHDALLKDDVEPAFKKFDKDGSGAIDK